MYFLSNDVSRMIEDVNTFVHVNDWNVTADHLTTLFLQHYTLEFAPIDKYGDKILAYLLGLNEDEILVELEVFDQAAWPHRPQYKLTTATRTLRTIDTQTVKLFSPDWLFREKVLAQHQRQGSAK